MNTPLLSLQAVTLRTGLTQRPLLQDLSLQIVPGDRMCLIGPPGSGKTLLLRLLAGLVSRDDHPLEGQMQLQGRSLADVGPLAWRRAIAWLPQSPSLLGMTVREAIAYPLQLQRCAPAIIQQQLHQVADGLRLPDRLWDQAEAALSLGERQLVGLARALVLQPKVLLVDGWMGGWVDGWGVDGWESSDQTGLAPALCQTFVDLSETQGVAILWAIATGTERRAADWRAIAASCQRLLVLEQGKLVQDVDLIGAEELDSLVAGAIADPDSAASDEDWD